MKWWFVLLLPLLGGCLSPLSPEIPMASGSDNFFPDTPASDRAAAGESASVAAPVTVSRQPFFKPDFDNLFNDQSGAPYSLLDFDQLFNEDVDETADPETMADNMALSGMGEDPPQDEGTTMVADAVAFDFPVVENEKVRYYIDYFTGPARATFTRWLERSTRYLPMMQQIFAEEGLPQDLVYLALVESGFNNRAYSWAHAAGPWQFIDSTGRLYGMENDWWRDERRDFEKATRAAARFLKDLHGRFDGDWYLAVASYNAGPGKIQRAIDMYDSRDFWEISRHSYLKTETKHYVPKLLATLLIAKEPEKYGFIDVNYQEPLLFETVDVPTTTDLDIVAKFCDVSYEDIKNLNPELSRWCTPPGAKNYTLRIPAGKKEQFSSRYISLPANQRANYHRHRVRSGDTLLALAKKYGIRVQDIVAMNSIRNPRALQIGADLILPLRKGWSELPLKEIRSAAASSRKGGQKTTYSVRRGDTLWTISQKFDVSEKQLRVLNSLGQKTIIQPGQVLTVAAGAAGRAKTEKTAKTVSTKVAKVKTIVYQVQAGDSFWDIATRHEVTTAQLLEWNDLSRKHVLQPGEKLTIKAAKADDATRRKITYEVRRGDTLWDIGRRFDVATHQIMEWNRLAAEDVLQPGDKLTLLIASGQKG